MSRHAAKQLPRTGHGDSLCKHVSAGSCTWWCSYRRFAKVCLALFVVVAGFGALSFFLDEAGGLDRLVDAAIAVGLYSAAMLVLIAVANRHDGGDHY